MHFADDYILQAITNAIGSHNWFSCSEFGFIVIPWINHKLNSARKGEISRSVRS